MINTIVAVFKYSALILTVLVLSHIVQIRGTTISQHVENGMNWVSGGRHASITRVSQTFSSALHRDSRREPAADADDLTRDDQKELNSVIHNSSKKHGLIK